MTDEADTNRVEIEQLLQNVRPAEPSALLKNRVVDAARDAWNEAETAVPWRIALGRLAAAAVAAVFIISCANYLSNRMIAPWQPREPTAVNIQNYGVDEFPEISFGPLLGRVAALHDRARRDTPGALAYRERMQKMLAETECGGPSDASAPAEGRSRLLPAPLEFRYS
jgi:hypothetical protein